MTVLQKFISNDLINKRFNYKSFINLFNISNKDTKFDLIAFRIKCI